MSRRPLVIGLRGLAGAGKSTLAALLCTHWNSAIMSGRQGGFMFARGSMAAPIKEGLLRMGISKETSPSLYRRFAQEIGATCRAESSDWWCRQFRAPAGYHCVIDDIRYPNEAYLCDLIFFIEADGFPVADLGERAWHESEQWNRSRQGRIDAVIANPKDHPLQAIHLMLPYIESRLTQEKAA